MTGNKQASSIYLYVKPRLQDVRSHPEDESEQIVRLKGEAGRQAL
jgi:hypothetical protein